MVGFLMEDIIFIEITFFSQKHWGGRGWNIWSSDDRDFISGPHFNSHFMVYDIAEEDRILVSNQKGMVSPIRKCGEYWIELGTNHVMPNFIHRIPSGLNRSYRGGRL